MIFNEPLLSSIKTVPYTKYELLYHHKTSISFIMLLNPEKFHLSLLVEIYLHVGIPSSQYPRTSEIH